MHINYINDRVSLGYACFINRKCGIHLVSITDSSYSPVKTAFSNGKKTFMVIGAVTIIVFSNIEYNKIINNNITCQQSILTTHKGLATRGGTYERSKFGSSARAKADARKSSSKSSGFADAFVPQDPYCRYKGKQPITCQELTRGGPAIPSGEHKFTGVNKPGNSDTPSKDTKLGKPWSAFKGGPTPFAEFDYDNPAHTRSNVDFSNQRRMSHSFDGHAKKCFGINENRNKESLARFINSLEEYITSPQTEQIEGSYRYDVPAYHYKDPKSDLIVTVDARNNEYISVRNATEFQLEKLEFDGNLDYDSRPSMELRIRGSKF